MQSKLVQGFGSRIPAKAVELLAMDTDKVAQIVAPPQDGAKDIVELRQIQLIRDRNQADHHAAHMA